MYGEALGTRYVNGSLRELLMALQTWGRGGEGNRLRGGLRPSLWEDVRLGGQVYFEMEMSSKQADGRRLVGRARPKEMEAQSGPPKKAVCKRGK